MTWPSVRDREVRDECIYCEADNGQPHQIACPLYLPVCVTCGKAVKKVREEPPVCASCRPMERVA